MSLQKTVLYNVRFSFKTLQANCQRPSCKVHIFIKVQNQQRKLNEISQMKKNLAVFNSQFMWDFVPLRYDMAADRFNDTLVIISIHYETSEQGTRTNKLKVGQVTLNLGQLLNSKSYRINSIYSVEKCYDPNAKLKMAIDLTEADDHSNFQKGSSGWPSKLEPGPSTANWKLSKVREKMNDDQKVMLQNKLYEYQDKLEKYRESHNDQIKKLSETIEKKEERISALITENSLMGQTMQHTQMQLEKFKNRTSALEKEHLLLQQSQRQLTQAKDAIYRDFTFTQNELVVATNRIEQLQSSNDKKEQHYKQQLQKYTQRYMDSENGRNKIIFELQTKLKEELLKKDQYYIQLLQKLEAKTQQSDLSSRQITVKREREAIMISEQLERSERQKHSIQSELQLIQQEKIDLLNFKASLEEQVTLLIAKSKNLESEYQMCLFSNANLQRELQKAKSEAKIQNRNMDELKYQMELANKTVEQQESIIVKLNRQIKTHKEREYYMEEKYQDELEQKTYNEECIKGSNYFYKTQVKKYQIKLKFLEQKIQDAQTLITNLTKQKQKLQQEVKNNSKIIFENGHQILRLQSENKKLLEKIDELETDNNQKQVKLKEVEQKFAIHSNQYDQQINHYIATINQFERQIKQVTQKRTEDAHQWSLQFQKQNSEKNNLLSQLQAELQSTKSIQNKLKQRLEIKEQRELQLENELRAQKQKNRSLQKEGMRTKFQLKKCNDELDALVREQSKQKKQILDLKNEASLLKSELQRQNKKMTIQKQSHIYLIKWILDRNWEDGNKQFVQHAGSDIDLEMIQFVNRGLEKIYGIWDRSNRNFQQARLQNQKMAEELTRLKLEQQYQQFGNTQKIGLEFTEVRHQVELQSLTQLRPLRDQIPQPILDLSSSFQVLKNEELKHINSQLNRELAYKNTEIENLNQQIFQERTKVSQLNDELRSLRDDYEGLKLAIDKKNAVINQLHIQLSNNQYETSNLFAGTRPSTNKIDHKTKAQANYAQRKAISNLESNVSELSRQNLLQKSKIQLLQTRLKVSSQKNVSDSQKISNLQKLLKEKEDALRKVTKESEAISNNISKMKKQLEVTQNRLSKKQEEIVEYKNQIEQLKKTNDILHQQNKEWQQQCALKEKKLETEWQSYQKQMRESAQTLALEKSEKDKLFIEQQSTIGSLRSSLKEAERRIASLEQLVKKSKDQIGEQHEKILRLIQSLGEAEQLIKDLKLNENLIKQNYQKVIGQLRDYAQAKEFELEELKFSNQSKIMQIQKQLEEG